MKANWMNTNKPRKSRQCTDFQALLLQYADRALTPERTHAVDAHLAGCQTCASELAQIRRAESALSAASKSIPAPGDLYAGFAAKLANEPVRRVNTWRYAVPAFAMAALALVINTALHNQNPIGLTINQDNSGVVAVVGTKSNIEHLPFEAPIVGRIGPLTVAKNLAAVHLASGSLRSKLPGLVRRERESEKQVAYAYAFSGMLSQPYGRSKIQSLGRNMMSDALVPERIPESSQTNLYAVNETVDNVPGTSIDAVRVKANLALSYTPTASFDEWHSLDRYSTTLAAGAVAAPPAVSFALYVQDDERGFTAEAHDAGSGIPARAKAASDNATGGNGVKIEVEFDDTPAL